MPLEMVLVLLILFVLCIFGYTCGQIASNKDYSFGKWFWFGFFLFPLALYRAIHLPEPDYFTLKRTEEPKKAPTEEATRLFSESFLGKQADLAAPVDLTGYDVYQRQNGSRFAALLVRTHVGKPVTSLLLSVTELDEAGNPLGPSRAAAISDLSLSPAAAPAEPLVLELSSPRAHRLQLAVREAFFDDHTSCQSAGPQWISYTIEHPADLTETLAMKELTGYAQCYPRELAEGWLCICGQPNAPGRTHCTWCGLEKETVFAACTPEKLAPRVAELKAQAAARAERQKEAFDTKTAREQEEIQTYQSQVQSRRQRFAAMVRRRKKRILATVGTLLVLFVGISAGYKWMDRSQNAQAAAVFVEAGQWEMAHDAYVRAGRKDDAQSIEETLLPLHAVNTDQESWKELRPDAVADLPEGAFLCDVVDDQVFYRQTSDGMDKTIWQKTIGKEDARELFTYDEKARTYVYLEGWFGVLQTNRVGNSTLLLADLETGETVRYNYSTKVAALAKTLNNQLLIFFEGSTWPENYYLVYRNFYGCWISRRITKGTYAEYSELIWYDCSVLE